MGKTGARKRVANKLGEQPFNVEDRVQHQIRKKDKELLNMYHWHEEQMEELRDECEQKINKQQLNLNETELREIIKQKDIELNEARMRETVLRKKVEDGEENRKILEQSKELIHIMLAHHYCYSKKNVWIINQAQTMGVIDADDYNSFASQLDDETVEKHLVNPILDLIQLSKSIK